MKFEKLNDAKIKIILTEKDIELNNVSMENIFSNSADSQKLLENMITMAGKEIGFEPGDAKLLVEAIVTSNNEYVFTITKLCDERCVLSKNLSSFIFKFNHFDDCINLCTFLKNLSNLNFKTFSQNFSLVFYNGTYFLQALDVEHFSLALDYARSVFAEFGKDVSYSPGIDGILNEYGKVVFSKDAIIKCIKLYNKKSRVSP